MTSLHFALHVFLDAHGVSIFTRSSVRRRWRVTATAIGLLVVGLAVPQLFPRVFNAAPLRPIEWALVLVLPLAGRLLLRLYGPFARGMQRLALR
jgi:hypothetical protein